MVRIASFLLVAITVTPSYAEIIIDSFSVPGRTNDDVFSGRSNSWGLDSLTQAGGAPDILGGNRYLEAYTASGGAGAQKTNLLWNGNTGDPDIDLTIQSNGVVPAYTGVAGIEWGRSSSLNQDFTGLGSNPQFVLLLEDIKPQNNPAGSATVSLILGDGDSTDEVALPLLTAGSLSGTYIWNSSDFSGIDFSDIDRIRLNIVASVSGNQQLNMSLSRFSAVPEPNTFCLIGAFSLIGLRYRRR